MNISESCSKKTSGSKSSSISKAPGVKGDSLDRMFAANVAFVDFRLSDKAKVLFSRLLFYWNSQTSLCYPSEDTLAFDLACTDRTIRSALRELEKLGYVQTEERWRGTRNNHYDLRIPSGRKEYNIAEEKCFKYRKNSSDKQKEEKNKEKRRIERTSSGTFASSPKTENCAERSTKNLEAVHLMVVERLGGGVPGWKRFAEVSDDKRQSIDALFRSGELNADQAVKELIDAVPD